MKKILLVSVILIGLVAGYFYMQDDQEEQIKQQFAHLAELVTKPEVVNIIAASQRLKELQRLFSTNCMVQIEEISQKGNYIPEEMASMVVGGWRATKELKLTFEDITFEALTETTATTVVTGRLTVAFSNGTIDTYVKEIRSDLIKVDGDWLFASFVEVAVLL